MAASPPRIVHVIPQIGIGGAEMQLCRLISGTPAGRAEHRVLFYSDSLDEQGFQVYRDSGIVLTRVARGSGGSPAFLWRLTKAVTERRPDIVHCWLPSAAFWGRWAATLAGAKRIVLAIRNTHIDLVPLLRISRLADGGRIRYLVNSTATAEAVTRLIGAPPERTTVIWNGIDLRERPSTALRESLLQRYGCPPGTWVVLTVGRLTAIKNYPMLLRVAARCRGRLPVHFFVVGHGDLEVDLKNLANQLNVSDTVHFLGLRRDVSALLGAADLFCYTSRYEGFPNALLEAMEAGRPIVTTRFAGVEDLISPGLDARVVDLDDDEAAFQEVRTLLEDPAAAARLGAAARRTVEERFTTERMVEATLAYYNRIMSGLA